MNICSLFEKNTRCTSAKVEPAPTNTINDVTTQQQHTPHTTHSANYANSGTTAVIAPLSSTGTRRRTEGGGKKYASMHSRRPTNPPEQASGRSPPWTKLHNTRTHSTHTQKHNNHLCHHRPATRTLCNTSITLGAKAWRLVSISLRNRFSACSTQRQRATPTRGKARVMEEPLVKQSGTDAFRVVSHVKEGKRESTVAVNITRTRIRQVSARL